MPSVAVEPSGVAAMNKLDVVSIARMCDDARVISVLGFMQENMVLSSY
jgi:hypothetical protein